MSGRSEASAPPRVFLVVVDDTPEHHVAVQYAARRAAHTGGRLALLHEIEPAELQHFRAIEELAREERREAADALVTRVSYALSLLAGVAMLAYSLMWRAN